MPVSGHQLNFNIPECVFFPPSVFSFIHTSEPCMALPDGHGRHQAKLVSSHELLSAALLNINLHQVINHQKTATGLGHTDSIFYHTDLRTLKGQMRNYWASPLRSLHLVTASVLAWDHQGCVRPLPSLPLVCKTKEKDTGFFKPRQASRGSKWRHKGQHRWVESPNSEYFLKKSSVNYI